jgi:hypothetical protein
MMGKIGKSICLKNARGQGVETKRYEAYRVYDECLFVEDNAEIGCFYGK